MGWSLSTVPFKQSLKSIAGECSTHVANVKEPGLTDPVALCDGRRFGPLPWPSGVSHLSLALVLAAATSRFVHLVHCLAMAF